MAQRRLPAPIEVDFVAAAHRHRVLNETAQRWWRVPRTRRGARVRYNSSAAPRACSSVGQSRGLIILWSLVRVQPGPPSFLAPRRQGTNQGSFGLFNASTQRDAFNGSANHPAPLSRAAPRVVTSAGHPCRVRPSKRGTAGPLHEITDVDSNVCPRPSNSN